MSKKQADSKDSTIKTFTEADIPAFLDQIFSEFDKDNNKSFQKK